MHCKIAYFSNRNWSLFVPFKVIALNCLCFIFSIIYFPYFSLSLLQVIAISFPLLIALVFKIEKEWKIRRAIKKISHKPIYKPDTKYEAKRLRLSDNFCYRNVRRAITKWGTIEKSPILLSQYWKIEHYDIDRVTTKNYFAF